MKNKKFKGWILIIIGLLGVFIPHIGFIAKTITNLSSISHALLEIVSGIVILAGAIILSKGRLK